MIDRLEADIRQYRIEYQRFLNGEATIPPEELRAELRKRINEIVAKPQLSGVDRFRLTGLESRFNSLNELFRRRQRSQPGPQRSPETSQEVPAASADLGAGSDARQVRALYEAIYAERSSEVGLDDFHAYLSRRAEELRKRTGCERVRFTIRHEGGTPKLKARGLRGSGDDTAGESS